MAQTAGSSATASMEVSAEHTLSQQAPNDYPDEKQDQLKETVEEAPKPHLSSRRKYAILIVLSAAFFFDVYNACAVITALPTLGEDLGFEASALQWVISAYTLTFAAFMLVSGRFSDIFHPKPVFVVGTLIVGLLNIPLGASVSPIMMIVFRAVQGIGAAMNTPTAVAMVSMTFPDPMERGRAFAVYGAFGQLGNATGFVLGGVLTDRLNWRWVYYLMAIVIIPFSIVSWWILPPHQNQTSKEEKKTIDWYGVFTLTAGLILFVFALSEGSNNLWGTARVIAPLVISIFLFAGFFVIESIVKDPAVPPRTWSNKNFIPLFFYAWSIYWWALGNEMQFVQVFMDVWNWSALSAAVHCLPLGITAAISSYITGLIAHRVPRRILMITGQTLMGVGVVLFALADTPDKYWSHIVPGMILGWIGLAPAYLGCTIAVMEGARRGEEGVVGALNNTSYQVGATIGLAIISSITLGVNKAGNAVITTQFTGYQAAYWSLVAMNGLSIIIVAVFVRG